MSMEIDGEEVTSPLIYHSLDGIRIPGAARRLLDSLDKQKIRDPYSLNVKEAMADLRALLDYHERGRSGTR